MKIGLYGYGKMGKAIEALSPDQIAWRVNSSNAKDAVFEASDVVIEFTRPDQAMQNFEKLLKAGMPVITGTTGWLDQKDKVQALIDAHEGAFFYAPNFSIGVNIFFELNKWLATKMAAFKQYHPQIIDIHHSSKLDSPSGTGIALADQILAARDDYKKWVNDSSLAPGSLPIQSLREGKVPGTHTITYSSEIDLLSITHEAKSRDGFALGALSAAKWLWNEGNPRKGMYTMQDMLAI